MNGNEKRRKQLASAGLILTTMIWGSAFVVMKHSIDVIPPTYVLAYRFTVAAIGMVLLFWKKVKTMSRPELGYGFFLGTLLFISYYLQTYGLKYTTASKNAFITTLYVILVPFLHWMFNRVKPEKNNLLAAVIAVIGLALLSLKGDLTINYGDFLTLLSGICFAVHIVFLDRYTAVYDPVRLTVMQMAGAAVCSWLVAALTEGACQLSVLAEVSTAGAVLYLGLASSMLGFLLQTVGQKYLEAGASSILLSFEAVFGLVFSVIFLHDPLTVRGLIGCSLMFAAAILASYQPKKQRKTEAVCEA